MSDLPQRVRTAFEELADELDEIDGDLSGMSLGGVIRDTLNDVLGGRDWEPLSEDVSMHHKHEDGRFCLFHSGLGVWTFDGTKKCLRNTHPAGGSR